MIWTFNGQIFDTEIEFKNFVMGYYYRLKEEQTNITTRCREVEKILSLRS